MLYNIVLRWYIQVKNHLVLRYPPSDRCALWLPRYSDYWYEYPQLEAECPNPDRRSPIPIPIIWIRVTSSRNPYSELVHELVRKKSSEFLPNWQIAIATPIARPPAAATARSSLTRLLRGDCAAPLALLLGLAISSKFWQLLTTFSNLIFWRGMF